MAHRSEMKDVKELVFPPSELDPQDWEVFRAVGHKVLDDVVEYLKSSDERPTIFVRIGSTKVIP